MIDVDEYNYFRKDLLKRKTKPYLIANRELAQDLFARFKLEQPDASLHFFGLRQFICYDKRARKNLAKMLKELIYLKEVELQELKELVSNLE